MPENQEPPLVKKGGITHHCFNEDKSMCAVALNGEDVKIYKTNASKNPEKWEETQTLTEHAQFVSGIDWCAKTNKIVTCSHDRNAYVWKFNDEGKWEPTLVVLRISRAATDVKWSPDGLKFAVTSGAKVVPICHYDATQDWWIANMIKKHKSTVLCVDWSPCSKMIVTGACDYKARLFDAKIQGEEDGDDTFGLLSLHAGKKFGDVLKEFDDPKAWVNSVSWSKDGGIISFAGHGSTLHFIDVKNGMSVQTIQLTGLPYTHVGFPGQDSSVAVAVGFDNNPTVYKKEGSEYKEISKLDPEEDGKKKASTATTARSAAFAKFQAADSTGAKFGEKVDKKEMYTFHKNLIVGVKYYNGKITTSGYDGRILEWDVK